MLNGVWFPKEEDSKKIDQFRMISLLNVKGKILFSIVARRLGGFLSSKTTSTRWCKRVTQLIREVRENKGDLAVLWLDLANAYGSFP